MISGHRVHYDGSNESESESIESESESVESKSESNEIQKESEFFNDGAYDMLVYMYIHTRSTYIVFVLCLSLTSPL